MKIYLAGKIAAGDWRHTIVRDLRALPAYGEWDPESPWPICERAILGLYDYCGPYFVSDDHGCAHGANSHGVGLGKAVCAPSATDQSRIARRCMEGLIQADCVFAWMDSLTAYGTFVEIGAAHAMGTPIYLAGPHRWRDLWFVYETAYRTTFQFQEALPAFCWLLDLPLPRRQEAPHAR